VQLPELALTAPTGLDGPSWAAIHTHAERLRNALRATDHPLAIGSAKELVESVARVVLVSRGNPPASSEEYDSILAQAHAALEYQPGKNLAHDAAVRGIASNAKKIAGRLREMRNEYGTGHGRTTVPVVEDEAVVMAVEAALLWVRWSLRRLEHLLAGQLTPLLNDLVNTSFTLGSLTDRLVAADLSNLAEPDQRRLGVAIGQRASRGTFVVRINGMEDPLIDSNDANWPPAYRAGAVEGSFITDSGQLHIEQAVVLPAARLANTVPDPAAFVKELASKAHAAGWSPEFAQRWRVVAAEMRRVSGELSDGEARATWLELAGFVESTGATLAD
jgi:hypothetical protein